MTSHDAGTRRSLPHRNPIAGPGIVNGILSNDPMGTSSSSSKGDWLATGGPYAPTTATIGLIEAPLDLAVETHVAWGASLGRHLDVRAIPQGFGPALANLLPLAAAERRRHIFLATQSGWTAFFPTSDTFNGLAPFIGSAESLMEPLIRRTSFDLDCPAEQLTYKDLGYGSVGVLGCGVRATYRLVSGVGWILDSQSADPGVQQTEPVEPVPEVVPSAE